MYCCCRKSPLGTLIPVALQLDSCHSEAVVGSSSDVASTSRSRHVSTDSSCASSPDSFVPVKRAARHCLVDALSRYFTPSDKRRSRVSLNALPHASPRSHPHSLTPAADTTHVDDTLPTLLPPKYRHRMKLISSSGSDEQSLLKHDNAVSSGNIEPHVCDSPTSQLSPSTCLPSESKLEVWNSTKLVTSVEERARSDDATAETAVKEAKKLSDAKTRKRRQTQLSLLHDSLSNFFSAEGERKRTPAQYVESEFSLKAYHHFEYKTKRQQFSAESTSQHDSRVTHAASWPSQCHRLSNYNLSGNTFAHTLGLHYLLLSKIFSDRNQRKHTLDCIDIINYQINKPSGHHCIL